MTKCLDVISQTTHISSSLYFCHLVQQSLVFDRCDYLIVINSKMGAYEVLFSLVLEFRFFKVLNVNQYILIKFMLKIAENYWLF